MALRLVITGRVQGVFFRDWTVETARALDIRGWVRNRRDGTVEIHAEGADEALEAFAAACAEGPPAARVEDVGRRTAADDGLDDFSRRPTA